MDIGGSRKKSNPKWVEFMEQQSTRRSRFIVSRSSPSRGTINPFQKFVLRTLQVMPAGGTIASPGDAYNDKSGPPTFSHNPIERSCPSSSKKKICRKT